jgi:hypothetical protein
VLVQNILYCLQTWKYQLANIFWLISANAAQPAAGVLKSAVIFNSCAPSLLVDAFK